MLDDKPRNEISFSPIIEMIKYKEVKMREFLTCTLKFRIPPKNSINFQG